MRSAIAILATALVGTAASVAAARDFPSEVVARHSSGTDLENLVVDRNGAVLYTNYFDSRIEAWRAGRSTVFARVSVHPMSIVEVSDGFLVLGQGAKFSDGAAALRGTNKLVELDRAGKVRRTIDLPDVVLGNGMVRSGQNAVLITDSFAGLIWRVDLESGKASPWFRDPQLSPDPGQPLSFGVNGIKRDRRSLVLTSSLHKTVYRLRLGSGDRPVGQLMSVATAQGADDLAVARDGTIYLATHGTSVVRIDPKGRSTAVLTENVDGCTSAALSPDGRTLYVLGTGGFFEGKKGEATLVKARVIP